jgi:hypothetical protein
MSSDFHFERATVAPDIVLWQMFGEPTELGFAALLREAEQWLTEQESRGKSGALLSTLRGSRARQSPSRVLPASGAPSTCRSWLTLACARLTLPRALFGVAPSQSLLAY